MKFIFNSNYMFSIILEVQTKSEKIILKTASETGKSHEVVYGKILNFYWIDIFNEPIARL